MKKYFLLLAALFWIQKSQGLNITIIESQSINSGHTMDTMWLSVCNSLGHNAAIYPQSTLDSVSFLANTDILIVSSGVIALPANGITTILQFILQGGDVYLQSEYDPVYSANQAFQFLVNLLGGGFSWNGITPNTLIPMNVLGSLSNTPNTIFPINGFWYGSPGIICSNIEPFLEYQGNYYGFVFCPSSSGLGRMLTTSDQDWIRTATPNELLMMENILYNMADSAFACNASSYPMLNLGSDTTFCPGDTIVLNAGAGFTTYQWQNGSTDSIFVVTAPGIYSITVTTPCNTYNDTIIMSLGNCGIPLLAFASSDTTFCEKHCIDFFDLSQNSPVSWQWFFPGAAPDTSTLQNPSLICYTTYGVYDVKLIGCNATGCDSILITGFINVLPVPPTPVITQSNDTLFTSGNYLFAWFNVDSSSVVLSTDSFLVVAQNGSYFVVITDSNGCEEASNIILVNTGIGEYSVLDGIVVSNSYDGNFTITLPALLTAEPSFAVYDVAGKRINYAVSRRSEKEILLTVESRGMFFIEITAGNLRRVIKAAGMR